MTALLCCGLSRVFGRGARTNLFRDAVDNFNASSVKDSPQQTSFVAPSEPQKDEETMTDVEPSVHLNVEVSEGSEKPDIATETPQDERIPNRVEKSRRNAPPFFRSFFKPIGLIEGGSMPWIRCEFNVDDERQYVVLSFRIEDELLNNKTAKASSSPTSTIQSFFRIRGRKQREEQELQDLIRARHPSNTSAKQENAEDEANNAEITNRPRSVFCFGWGQTGVIDDGDEAIEMTDGAFMADAPPGLVGLLNLGNTCFLNAALQCLRCTPGFATLIVPELRDGFEAVIKRQALGEERFFEAQRYPSHKRKKLWNRSYSSASVICYRPTSSEWERTVAERSNSLPSPLPYELGGRLAGESGLAGGSVSRQTSVPNLTLDASPAQQVSSCDSSNALQKSNDGGTEMHHHHHDISNKNALTNDQRESWNGDVDPTLAGQSESMGSVTETEMSQIVSCRDTSFSRKDLTRDQHDRNKRCTEEITSQLDQNTNIPTDPPSATDDACEPSETTANDKDGKAEGAKEEETSKDAVAEDQTEVPLSPDFISAFQRLVMDVCLGEAEKTRSPRDLYLQLKKLPQGEWFCDGGQHDCQEIFKVLLDAIHASYADDAMGQSDVLNRLPSSVSSHGREELEEDEEIEIENLKAGRMWQRYLSRDSSPITDVFAGQLQIVRTCQKCNSHSTTYEPFWDLSLSLSRERVSWFSPGRMPSSLDDLLRAFTASELLQGDEAPYCDNCGEKSPATRRILIHRFPKVLVINIKRFKYTKDGREKLTSNISFPIHSLQLQSFASREHAHKGIEEYYDLYAVSNHFGTLGGGHYTAFCKVRDNCGGGGWYSFNDKVVTKIGADGVVTPHAYILFYAKRPVKDLADLDSAEISS